METGKAEKLAARRSRISLGALTEIEKALRDYDKEVLEAGRAGDGLTETTIKTYGKAEKFVDWLKYDFAPGEPPNGPGYTRPRIETPNIKRLAAKKSRVSLPALLEAEAALDEYIREVLHARRGERATNQLSDPADYFVRWLKYEFAPGSRKRGKG
jgi:histone H3/H4